MNKTITSTEARKNFAKLTDEARTQGITFSVVRHGEEIAQITPPKQKGSQGLDFDAAVKEFVDQYDGALEELAKR